MRERGDTIVNFSIWDTSGQENFTRLRVLSYVNVDVFLLIYCASLRETFESIEALWEPEVRHHCPKAALILVGLHGMQDLGEEGKEVPQVTAEEGAQMAKRLSMAGFHEVQLATGESVAELFNSAATTALENQERALVPVETPTPQRSPKPRPLTAPNTSSCCIG